MLLDNVLDLLLLEVLELVLLHVENHLGSTAEGLTRRVGGDGERSACGPFISLAVSDQAREAGDDEPAADSQMYCSSSLCLVVTVTLSATR